MDDRRYMKGDLRSLITVQRARKVCGRIVSHFLSHIPPSTFTSTLTASTSLPYDEKNRRLGSLCEMPCLLLALSPGVDRDQRGLQAYVRHNLSRSHDRDALCEAESYLYVSRGSGL